MPVRCAIVLPVPVPYREPLLERLCERGAIEPRVIYLAGAQPGWDMSTDWFAAAASYPRELLEARQRTRPGRTPLLLPRGLGAALDRVGPEVVVSSEFGPATWRALAWCRTRRRPLLVLSELTPWSDAELSRLQRRIHRALVPRIDGFIVTSSQGRERLRRFGVEPPRIEVAVQSADIEPLLRLVHSGPRSRTVRVLCVGRLVADKNLDVLIDAFSAAGFAEGEAELILAGTGPLEDALRPRAGAGVSLIGYVGPADLPALYASADVLALVSTYEPFGVTMREGAAAGLPLLCTRRAGAAGDIAVEGENALLVDPEDGGEISAALGRLVREPELRERLGRGSRAVTERHPTEADAQAWERAVLRVAC